MAFRMLTSVPFSSTKALLKGLIAGSLMVSALMNDYYILWRVLLFTAGLFVFMEGMFPYNQDLHTGGLVISTIAGGAVALCFTFYGGIVSYTVLMIIVALGLYGYSYSKNKTKTWF